MLRRTVCLIALVATAACDANQLSPATVPNVVDTVVLGSLSNAALEYPAGFDVTIGAVVRTDQSPDFDFIYNVDSLGRHVFLPLHAIAGLGNTVGSNPGFIKEPLLFQQIIAAPTDTYLTTDTIAVAAGDVYIARSRVSCYLGVPQYGKIHVLSFDEVLHTVSLEVLVDANCGYKNLQVGLPEN
ncbi:MAG TPA: hypothetical protein VGM77_13990 [Gemmatimonadales bacterium]|jgi:hypothetical protein